MKSISIRIILLAMLFSLAALSASYLRAESKGERQAIYTAPSRTPILSRLVLKDHIGFTQFTSIEVPGALLTTAQGINNRGQIVGGYVDQSGSHGFLLDGGAFTTIEIPDASDTFLYGINDSGLIVGTYWNSAGVHGFFLEAGSLTTIEFPGSDLTFASGINEHRQIVGSYAGSDGFSHGFLFDNGTYTTIEVPGAVSTWAEEINSQGQIVGYSVDSAGRYPGFLLEDGIFTIIDVPESTIGNIVKGTNSRGQILGSVAVAQYLGLLYDRGGLTLIGFPSASSTLAIDINDRGQVVGEYIDQNSTLHGFVAE